MYLFWEEIKKSDEKGGDRFFRCRHGDSKKELKMTKGGKGSFTGELFTCLERLANNCQV
jgi:hypothetical protein